MIIVQFPPKVIFRDFREINNFRYPPAQPKNYILGRQFFRGQYLPERICQESHPMLIRVETVQGMRLTVADPHPPKAAVQPHLDVVLRTLSERVDELFHQLDVLLLAV